MALILRTSLVGPPADSPEDFLYDSLGTTFTDDIANIHGDAEHQLEYTSPHLRKRLLFDFIDPADENDRKLFSHYMWNASLQLAEFIEAGSLDLDTLKIEFGPSVSSFDVRGLATLELGAGSALPSIMAALLGAKQIVVTDYPAEEVLKTLHTNVTRNTDPIISPAGVFTTKDILVEGHSWGKLDDAFSNAHKHSFDRLFLADCLWMPWEHSNLHNSVAWFLRDDRDARCLVVAGFHTGRAKMRDFFDEAALSALGLEVEVIWERDCDGNEREWMWDRGAEDVAARKRWLVCSVLKRKS